MQIKIKKCEIMMLMYEINIQNVESKIQLCETKM